MKKSLLIACLCCLTFGAFVQEERPAIEQSASSEMIALQTAASLAKYRYATFSPISLIEAARIFGIQFSLRQEELIRSLIEGHSTMNS